MWDHFSANPLVFAKFCLLIQRKVHLLTFPSSSANFSSLHTDFNSVPRANRYIFHFLVFSYFSEYFPSSHYWITIILCRFCAVFFAPFVNRVLNIFLRLFFLSYCTFPPPSLHLSLVCLRRALIDANCLWLQLPAPLSDFFNFLQQLWLFSPCRATKR